MQGDQRTAHECYLVSIRPLVERTIGQETPPTGKKPQTGPPSLAAKALVIHIVTLAKLELPHPEAVHGIEQIPLENARPNRTVQLGGEMEACTRHSLVTLLQAEMPSIDPAVMEHRVNVDPLHKPIIQKK